MNYEKRKKQFENRIYGIAMFSIYRIKIDGLYQMVLAMGVKPSMDFNNFDGGNIRNRSID